MRYHKFFPAFSCGECDSHELRITIHPQPDGHVDGWLECVNCGNMVKCGHDIELVSLGKRVVVHTHSGEKVTATAVPAKFAAQYMQDELEAHLAAVGVVSHSDRIAKMKDGNIWVNIATVVGE